MNTQDVRIETPGCTLAGCFVDVPGAVAAALLIQGSGPVDRDSDARLPLGMRLRLSVTRTIAETLSQAGVSTLRYDKRGVGATDGDYFRAGMDDLRDDARAARDWLAAHTPGLPLLVIGHSEGTYYAAQLAAERKADGIVLLSGPTHTGAEVLTWQTRQIAPTLPRSAKFILRLMRTDVVRAQAKNMAKLLATTGDVARIQGRKLNARWFRDFAAYDPAPVLAEVTVPVLAITGSHDLQVRPDDVDAMGHLVRGEFSGHVVDGLSHILRPDPDKLGPRAYRRSARQPVSPEVLDLITAWIALHWGAAAPRVNGPR
jgi:alpha/beta superfamily hydrolase